MEVARLARAVHLAWSRHARSVGPRLIGPWSREMNTYQRWYVREGRASAPPSVWLFRARLSPVGLIHVSLRAVSDPSMPLPAPPGPSNPAEIERSIDEAMVLIETASLTLVANDQSDGCTDLEPK